MISKVYTVEEVCNIAKVSRKSLYLWEEQGFIKPFRTAGQHRRYSEEMINVIIGIPTQKEVAGEVFIYARCSTNKQKDNLERQIERLKEYCKDKNYTIVQEFSEIASGLNDNRKQLNRMMKLVAKRKIQKIIVEYKDRLARFGFNYIKTFCNSYDVEIEVIEHEENTDLTDEIVKDLVAIVASFSGRLMGKRGAQNKKAISEEKKTEELK
jgi:putative resolvase